METITLKGSPDVVLLTNQPLKIVYDPTNNKLFYPQEILKIEIENNLQTIPSPIYTGIDVTLVAGSINVSGSTSLFGSIDLKLQSQFQLEAFYKIRRKYNVSSIAPLLNINSSLLTNNKYKYIDNSESLDFRMVRLTWEVVGCNDFEFEKYQVQILKLSNTDSDDGIYKDNLFDVNTKIDWNDAISIEVGDSKKFIDIYLTQGKGIYTWRVRPIGNKFEGGISNSQNWGLWNDESVVDGTTIIYNHELDEDLVSTDFFRMYIEENINDDLNWVHSRVFNESDESSTKFYDEITYSDDLLGKRQYQKKVNSADDNLTAEYYPDYHGNSVLSSLFAPIGSNSGWQDNYNDPTNTPPSPTHGSDLLYKRFTLTETTNSDPDDNTDKYSFLNFGTDKLSDEVDGGSIYNYYDESSEKGIPSSEGYPYTRSIYYNDGTNRLKEQRLPGPVSYTNSNNLGKIRTFYATATEKELVSLFGKEAPNPEKVFKVINIDQNNVYHYTYKGVDGKVIATAYRNIATDDLLAINNTVGHSFEITDSEELITDYFPIDNKNKLSFTEEKDIFIRDGSTAQVDYSIIDKTFEIYNVCNFDVNYELTQATETPDIGVDIKIITSNNEDYNGTPSVINLSTSTGAFESSAYSALPFTLSTNTEPANYKLSRKITLNEDDIDAEVEGFKSSIKTVLEDEIFKDEIEYLEYIINGFPGKSIEQFRKNLVPIANLEATPPNENWGWTDANGNTVNEGLPTPDGYYTKKIPSNGGNCDSYSVKIPQNICNSSDACYLEQDLDGRDDYEKMLIQNFASRKIYLNGNDEDNDFLDLTLIENYFWEPTSLSSPNILKRLIPTPSNTQKFDKVRNTHSGAFNKMIVHMLAEEYESEHYINASLNQGKENQKIWTQEEVCDCWNTAIDKFQTVGIIIDTQSGKDILNPEFSLMDAFLSCTGTMFKGYSNTPFAADTYCSSSNTEANPLVDGGTFKVCYDHPDDNPLTTPLYGEGIRAPNSSKILFGGGYFENAYKYLPLFIDQSQISNIFNYDYTDDINPTENCPCESTIVGDFNDIYTINLNPEYDTYVGLTVDDPRNLEFYHQFAGINNNKTIGDIQNAADFFFDPFPFFRNEYKMIYEQWHGREIYINYAANEDADPQYGKDKRGELPKDKDPCNDRGKISRDAVMNNLSKSVGIDLPPCMECGSTIECSMSDVTAYLYQYVKACEQSCDTKFFRERIKEEFHTNPDAYYVLEDDDIRDFDFGTYEILNSTQMQKVGTTNVELMSTYNIKYITETEISRYEATLLANCIADCQPNCIDAEPAKYANADSKGVEANDIYKESSDNISLTTKQITLDEEPAFDTDCLIEDVGRIMKIISANYEIQLPKIDCDGNPSYCETGDKSDWKLLDVYDIMIENQNAILPSPIEYKKTLVSRLNTALKKIKVSNKQFLNNTDAVIDAIKNEVPNWWLYLENQLINEEKISKYIRKNVEFRSSDFLAFNSRMFEAYNYLNDAILSINDSRLLLQYSPSFIELPNLDQNDPEYENYLENYFKFICDDQTKKIDAFDLNLIANKSYESLLDNINSNPLYYRLYEGNSYSFFLDLCSSRDNEDNNQNPYKVIPFILQGHADLRFFQNFEDIIQGYDYDLYLDTIQFHEYFTVEDDFVYLNKYVYNANFLTKDEFWDENNFLDYQDYSEIWNPSKSSKIWGYVPIWNPAAFKRIFNSKGERIIHIKAQFLRIPDLEEINDSTSFCFRWITPGEEEFDQPFEQELIVNDCEFNEPDMYLDMIKTQIEDIAYKLGEEYRSKIMYKVKDYVYGTDDDGTDDLDELKVIMPDEKNTKFTLYYYDHHGNLVKTVPPKGVNVDLNRDRDDLAVHDMETIYQYNSTGQLVASKSADQSTDKSVMIGSVPCNYDGETVYIYDLAGRLRFTVNSNQMEGKKRNEVNYPLATYYKYDKRGRLIETGEMHTYFANYNLLTTPEYFTVGDYLRWYLDMKKLERTNPSNKVTAQKFYKYQRQFSEMLLENLDFPSDKDPAGNFVYTGFINPLYNSGSLSALNYWYRPIKLKIITTYDSPQTLPFATDYRIDGVAPTQKYLRNRISNITRIPDSEWEDGSFFPNRVDSYYSYDPHGNVDWYYQYIQPHKTNAVQYGMLTHYEYDLISGNVTQIHYQPGKVDEFTQIYDYDTDNRLTEVNTTRFGILKETDARYKYYKHGPLKRKEYGSDYVQGLDYYYTIQGWLKGINDVNMNSYGGLDKLGGDALTTNRKFAYDAFAMSLNYYDDDFVSNANDDFVHTVNTLTNTLYNGNISSWEQVHNKKYNPASSKIADAQMESRLNEFKYDISGRLIDSKIFQTIGTGKSVLTPIASVNRYSSNYEYDLNGNITEIERFDDKFLTASTSTVQSSSFQNYTDNNSRVRPMNRLSQVTNTSTGIPKMYMYDNMGNILTKFDANNPNSDFHLIWTADGKIDSVIKFITVPNKANHTLSDTYIIKTSYYYDGMGNKVMTITEPEAAKEYPIGLRCNGDSTMLTLYDNCVECIEALGLKATYYGREAGGKTLALYDTDPPINDATGIYSCQVNYTEIWLDDWYVYGSEADGRIATVDPKEVIEGSGKRMTGSEFSFPVNMVGSPIDTLKVPIAMRERGISGVTGHRQTQQRVPDFRRYEIKDHLGNVRTVISDVKNPELTAPPITAWKYLADVKNISNMYPYGKSYGTNAIYNAAEDYRYGFNGMEKAKEVDDNTLTSKYRNADLETGNWWSRDPKESEAPSKSPYIMMGNNPITLIDPEGDKEYFSLELNPQTKQYDRSHMGPGDWLMNDRIMMNDYFKSANLYNLENMRYGEYTEIEQRFAFYNWFAEMTKKIGFETQWAGAAGKVSSDVEWLTNGAITWLGISSNDDLAKFANDGNEVIFNDVFPKLRKLYMGPTLKGKEAMYWDFITLAEEQYLVQPLYTKLSDNNKELLADNIYGRGVFATIYSIVDNFYNVRKAEPFPNNLDVFTAEGRWRFGLYNMGYNPFFAMPKVSNYYMNGGSQKKSSGRGKLDTPLAPASK